jgi:hypothetical protein
MTEPQPQCTHLNIRYDPIEHNDLPEIGITYEDRWRCVQCGAMFVRLSPGVVGYTDEVEKGPSDPVMEIDSYGDFKEKIEGQKFDQGKPRWDLVQTQAIQEYVKALTYGAEKYSPHGWRKVHDKTNKYFAALQRHIWAWRMGENVDAESGLHPLAHAMCCVAILLEVELEAGGEVEKKSIKQLEAQVERATKVALQDLIGSRLDRTKKYIETGGEW